MAVLKVSEVWRQRKEEEKLELAAGEISEDDCCMEELFPDAFIDSVESVLDDFVRAIDGSSTGKRDYPKVVKAVETVVQALNRINEKFGGAAIETGEREELCEYIDAVIVDHEIDLAAIKQLYGTDDLTHQWRQW